MSALVDKLAEAAYAKVEAQVKRVVSDSDRSGLTISPTLAGCREVARAIVEAMHEPSEEMLRGGAANCASWWTAGRTTPVYGHEPAFIWKAMIDALLSDGDFATTDNSGMNK